MAEYLMFSAFGVFAVIAGAGLAAAMYVIAERARIGEANRQEPNFGG